MPSSHIVACNEEAEKQLAALDPAAADKWLLKDSNIHRHAAFIGGVLAGRGVSDKLVILSSGDRLSMTISRLVHQQLERRGPQDPRMYPSDLIDDAGRFPTAVRSMHRLLSVALEMYDLQPGNDDLLVVTHWPLLAAVTNDFDVANNTVAPLDINWRNQYFNPAEEQRVLPELA